MAQLSKLDVKRGRIRIVAIILVTVAILFSIKLFINNNHRKLAQNKPVVAHAEAPVVVVEPVVVLEPTPEPKPIVEPPVAPEPVYVEPIYAPMTDNEAKNFIYQHESSMRLDAMNSIGCIGIGQNCPDKNGHYWLKDACPDWQTNYECQDAAFTNYANVRYGGWQGSVEFWKNNGWW